MRGIESGQNLRTIDVLFNVGTAAGLSDGELLERYASRGGEAAELAFAALVERHGPVVYRVCRRMLRDPNDAQDAFQAAFLVLIRKAHSIRNRESVGSWLYGVALRVASDARAATSRRLTHERNAARPELQASASCDLAEALTEEVGRLPEKFRVPIVLCDLEGYTCEEVARRLGWPLGTVRSRLTRGKERLRSRLQRRGLAPSSSVIVAALRMPAEAVPSAVVGSTLRTAVSITTGRAVAGAVSAPVLALSEGVLRTMLISKLKITAGAVLAGVIAAGSAGVLAQAGAGPDPNAASGPARVRYEIRISVDGKPSGEPLVAEVAEGSDILLKTPNEEIHIDRSNSKAPVTQGAMARGMMGMYEDALARQKSRSDRGDRDGEARVKNRGSRNGEASKDAGQPGYGRMMGMGMPGMQSMMRGGMAQGAGGMAQGAGGMAQGAGGMAQGAAGEAQNSAAPAADGSAGAMMGMMGRMGGMMGGPPPRDQEQRLREVERKLDEILKRLDDQKGRPAQ